MADGSKQAALEAAQLVLLKTITRVGEQGSHHQTVLNFAKAYALLDGSVAPTASELPIA